MAEPEYQFCKIVQLYRETRPLYRKKKNRKKSTVHVIFGLGCVIVKCVGSTAARHFQLQQSKRIIIIKWFEKDEAHTSTHYYAISIDCIEFISKQSVAQKNGHQVPGIFSSVCGKTTKRERKTEKAFQCIQKMKN